MTTVCIIDLHGGEAFLAADTEWPTQRDPGRAPRSASA